VDIKLTQTEQNFYNNQFYSAFGWKWKPSKITWHFCVWTFILIFNICFHHLQYTKNFVNNKWVKFHLNFKQLLRDGKQSVQMQMIEHRNLVTLLLVDQRHLHDIRVFGLDIAVRFLAPVLLFICRLKKNSVLRIASTIVTVIPRIIRRCIVIAFLVKCSDVILS